MKKKLEKIIMIVFIFMATCQQLCYAYVEKPDILLSCLNILEAVLFFCLIAMGLILLVYTKIAKKEKAKDILTTIFHIVGLLFLLTITILSFELGAIEDIILLLSIDILFIGAFVQRKKKLLTCICVVLIVLIHLLLIIEVLTPTPQNDFLPPQPVPTTSLGELID